jgi:hypothetical protein
LPFISALPSQLYVKAFLRLPPGLAFTQPNLPFLMQEIIGRLLA